VFNTLPYTAEAHLWMILPQYKPPASLANYGVGIDRKWAVL